MGYYDGKVVLITGGSSGIGAELGRELARRGARVGLLARREDRLQEATEAIRSDGGTAAWAAADVADEAGLHAAMDQLEQELGGVDIVIANAGFSRLETAKKFVPGRAAKIYDVNLMGFVHTVDWAMIRFAERKAGHVVGVASVASYLGMPGFSSYCGSKAAMRVHLQALRGTYKRMNVAVTTICPGFIESEMTEDLSFKTPFLWPTDKAVRVIADSIAKRKAEVVFPWQWRWGLVGFLYRLPRSWAEWLLGKMG